MKKHTTEEIISSIEIQETKLLSMQAKIRFLRNESFRKITIIEKLKKLQQQTQQQ